MGARIVVPELGESILEATVSRWLKKEGERVDVGDPIVELETEKASVEVSAETAGILETILRAEGEDVKVGDALATLSDAPASSSTPPKTESLKAQSPKTQPPKVGPVKTGPVKAGPVKAGPVKTGPVKTGPEPEPRATKSEPMPPVAPQAAPPENAADPLSRLEPLHPPEEAPSVEERGSAPSVRPPPPVASQRPRTEETTRMSRRRRTIAHRLVEAQRSAAMLTTFNEVDMTAILDTRRLHKDTFRERHGVNLGILSFFVKATVAALKQISQLNAEIRGDDLILKRYYDVGVAIGASEGLIVPVLRGADLMTFAEIEQAIKDFARRSEEGSISLEELRGGTFTITNGGVFGSLLSTPILNPPEVGILGLHKIEERPIAVSGRVEIRPMMYVALTYDHRVVDGREAVTFLVKIKELVEDPRRLLLET